MNGAACLVLPDHLPLVGCAVCANGIHFAIPITGVDDTVDYKGVGGVPGAGPIKRPQVLPCQGVQGVQFTVITAHVSDAVDDGW